MKKLTFFRQFLTHFLTFRNKFKSKWSLTVRWGSFAVLSNCSLLIVLLSRKKIQKLVKWLKSQSNKWIYPCWTWNVVARVVIINWTAKWRFQLVNGSWCRMSSVSGVLDISPSQVPSCAQNTIIFCTEVHESRWSKFYSRGGFNQNFIFPRVLLKYKPLIVLFFNQSIRGYIFKQIRVIKHFFKAIKSWQTLVLKRGESDQAK